MFKKPNLFVPVTAFVIGALSGHHFTQKANDRLARNEKLSLDVPYTKDEVTKRVPKAFSAAAKELVDPRTIDIRTGKETTSNDEI